METVGHEELRKLFGVLGQQLKAHFCRSRGRHTRLQGGPIPSSENTNGYYPDNSEKYGHSHHSGSTDAILRCFLHAILCGSLVPGDAYVVAVLLTYLKFSVDCWLGSPPQRSVCAERLTTERLF